MSISFPHSNKHDIAGVQFSKAFVLEGYILILIVSNEYKNHLQLSMKKPYLPHHWIQDIDLRQFRISVFRSPSIQYTGTFIEIISPEIKAIPTAFRCETNIISLTALDIKRQIEVLVIEA